MRAQLIKPDQTNGYNYSRNKEMVSAYSVIGKINGELREVVTFREYMGRSASASVVYGSLWVHGAFHCSGKGSAGGYGYHKGSAALQDAITSAGLQLIGSPYADENGKHYVDVPNPAFNAAELARLEAVEDWDAVKNYKWCVPATLRKLVKDTGKNVCHIDGCGSESMRSALLAIAKLAGARGKLLIVTH
jgi:hypothetical protein